ncbi:hypothetical protein [Floridanema evergladense]|uniref:Uncharacterized protein n=1 Tax=Floridaenema evergladense BLCC-F167 TaxID=3153639 RepID=A0ABV4WDC4_9CYAN
MAAEFYYLKLSPHALRDRTWYTRVNPDLAHRIVREHLVQGQPIKDHLYPPVKVEC